MGPCNLWNVCECTDTNAINTDTAEATEPVPFPRCPWALDLSDKPFPGRAKVKPDPNKLGGWYWESGFDRDPIEEMEYVRDWNFRAMYGAWDALKNVDKVLPNHRLNWSAYILGKRESRRLLGDVILSVDDLKNDRQFPDGCVPTGWSNDLHHADPRYDKGFEGDAFISKADFGDFPGSQGTPPVLDPLPLPLLPQHRQPVHGRALHQRHPRRARRGARDAHLRLRGRDHRHGRQSLQEARHRPARRLREAPRRPAGPDATRRRQAASCRIRRRTRPGATGDPEHAAVAGIRRRQPRQNRDASRSPARRTPGSRPTSCSTTATARSRTTAAAGSTGRRCRTSSSSAGTNRSTSAPRGSSPATTPAGNVIAPIHDFTLQWHDGTQWQDTDVNVEANTDPAWAATFPPVRTQRARLIVNKTKDDISRIWEIEFYQPIKD